MTSLRQLLPAALLAASAACGLTAVGSPVTASAAPIEWDIERYDDCMKGGASDDPSEKLAWTRKCCLDSGGVWNDGLGKCQSPPKDASATRWPGRIPVGVFTQDLTAAP